MEAIDSRSGNGETTVTAETPSPQPAALSRPEPGVEPADAAAARRTLLQFHRTGTLPAGVPLQSGLAGHVPALVQPYLSRDGLRLPYPVVLDANGGDPGILPLTDLMDRVVDAVCDDGDEGALRRRFLARIEDALRAAGKKDETDLEGAWWAAVDGVRPDIRADRKEAFEEAVRAATAHIPSGARLLACTETAPVAIARHVAAGLVAERGAPVLDEARRLGTVLADLLAVERGESHEAVEPDRLRDAVGGALSDAFDFDALSHLLDEAPHAAALSDERRARLEALHAALGEHANQLFGTGSTVLRPVSQKAARDAAEDRLQRLLVLYRDLEAARLESRHRYVPELHDAWLESLSPAQLSEDDLQRCPPLLVTADEASLDAAGIGHLAELLTGRTPVKVLLTLRTAPGEGGPASMLPGIAMTGGDACVVQAALSDVGTLAEGIRAAMRHDGPALVAVYAGPSDAVLPPYFAAALARDTRAVPSFVFRPGPGRPWADRLSLDGNENPAAPWLEGRLEVDGGAGDTESIETALTWIDFAVTRPEHERHFLPLDPAWETADLVTAHDYLALPARDRGERVPYVWCATPDGTLFRVVAARPAVDWAERALDRWQRLQELAGIHNSWAERAIADTRASLEAERDEAVAEARKAHADELERAVSEVAERIVSNIAASLLDLPTGAPAAPARTARPAAPAAPAEAAPAEAPAAPEPEPEPEEDEGGLSLDEAYIETVRCTSCNECTNLNGQIFAYNGEKQAYIKDASAGPYRDLVMAAEKCPVRIIHPGKPLNPDEPGLDELIERAKPFL